MRIYSYPSVLTYVLGAQKNRLIETVLLSTHNICFGWEIRKLIFVTIIWRPDIEVKKGYGHGVVIRLNTVTGIKELLDGDNFPFPVTVWKPITSFR